MFYHVSLQAILPVKYFVTVFALEVPSRVSFFVSLESLLVVKALFAEFALELPVVNH